MSMDARAKIEEMLRQKREGINNQVNSQNPSTPNLTTSKPLVVPKTNLQEPKEKTAVSSLEKINEMLRQRQENSSQKTQSKEEATVKTNVVKTELNVDSEVRVEVVRTLSTQTQTNESHHANLAKPRYGLCPNCLTDLGLVAGLYVCKNCSQHFVRRGLQGDLINCSDLPYGYCKCCETHFPLLKAQNSESLVCLVSQEKYLQSAKGYLRANELPFGLCSCCNLPNPLIVRTDQSICCINTNEEYIRNIDSTVVRKPKEVNLQNNQDVEQALNQGMAAFYYGGFIGGQRQEEPEIPTVEIPRRQRRRRWF